MPLYDFKCRRCGRKFEELVKLGETPECPACHAPDSERLFTPSAGIATDTTKARSTRQARRVASGVKREQDHAQREYERNYYKDHS